MHRRRAGGADTRRELPEHDRVAAQRRLTDRPEQTAIFATGAFFSGPTPGTGVMRRWTTTLRRDAVLAEQRFHDADDPASATTDGSNVTFSVDASDPDDNVGFVYVIYRDATETWHSATLAQDASGLWTGTAPAPAARSSSSPRPATCTATSPSARTRPNTSTHAASPRLP
jgi:hypothetical protein